MEQHKGKIKVIYCDIDGTLVAGKRFYHSVLNSWAIKVDKQNIEQINSLGQDIPFILISGRFADNISKFSNAINQNHGNLIAMNGSKIYYNHEVIYEKFLDNADSYKIMNYLDANNVMYYNFGDEIITTGTKTVHNPLSLKLREMFNVKISKDFANGFDYMHKTNKQLYKISINFKIYNKKIRAIEAYLRKEFPHLEITRSSQISLDINPANTNKGNAVKILNERMNIDLSNTAVIGDAMNDKSMFDIAAYSFSMTRADDDLKKQAAYKVRIVADAVKIIKNINLRK